MWQKIGGAVAAAALLAGCGSGGGEADIPGIEQNIEHGVAKQSGYDGKVTVNCPDQIDWRVGGDFHCIGKAGGQRFGVTVSMENDAGDITWRVDN
jgi:hypothetical protein